LISGAEDGSILVWNTSKIGDPLWLDGRSGKAAEFSSCWAELGSDDARIAYRTHWFLVGTAEKSVPAFRDKLRPASAPDAKLVRGLIDDLDHEDFERRDHASAELAKMGDAVRPLLIKARNEELPAETRRRIDLLLEALDVPPSGDELRAIRAVEVLERIGNPEARDVLATLAKGDLEARLTREAKATLERLARR
jgi:hypothetical protein